MCGRQACTLAPDKISKLCRYKDKSGNEKEPQWKSYSAKGGKQTYRPSPNIGPKSVTPVLVQPKKVKEFDAGKEVEERVISEMLWGLIPSWHKGGKEDFKFNMINCRSDTMLEKASFKGPFQKGQRCVVLAEGFFEWQTMKNGKKQPYFLQFKDELKEGNLTEIKCDSHENLSDNFNDEEDSSSKQQKLPTTEKRLLTMAALFDKWIPAGSEDEEVLTYTIITVNASKSLEWLHERMPAILETEEEVSQWLSHDVPASKAMELLQPKESLKWHPVSTVVNNVKEKSPNCMKEIDLTKGVAPSASSNLMNTWVKRNPREQEKKIEELDVKRCKLDT